MSAAHGMKRLLILSLGPFYYPDQIPLRDKYRLLSERHCGDIFAVVNNATYRHAQLSQFTVHGIHLPTRVRHKTLLRDICYGIWALWFALYRHYTKARYDAIIAPDPMVSGLLAWLIARLTGAKAIVEVNGQFESSFRMKTTTGLKSRLKERYTRLVLPWVLRHVDGVRLLYDGQVRAFTGDSPLQHAYSFGDFVPTARFKEGSGASRYVLFMGYPWHLKGVDILIRAFNAICDEFPDYSLKVIGFCPDKSDFIRLANGNPRIELKDPVEYDEVITLMSECSLFVLPSRTEAMGRVLLEAMASKKPVIGSNVDGIPRVITHGHTGLLFEPGNADDLAAKMRTVLSNPAYAHQLAENGYRFVHDTLSETQYVNAFTTMIERVTVGVAG